MSLHPKIYVACLASYNAGYLHGAWIDASLGINTIREEIHNMLAASPESGAEAWDIHDSEGFSNISITNLELEEIAGIAEFIAEHDELGLAVLDYASDLEQAKHWMEECYRGEYSSKEDFAHEFATDCMEIPNHLINYIDYGGLAYDLFIDDFLSIEVGYSIHVFWKD